MSAELSKAIAKAKHPTFGREAANRLLMQLERGILTEAEFIAAVNCDLTYDPILDPISPFFNPASW